MSRHRYPTEICRTFERTTIAKLQAALTTSKEPDNIESDKVNDSGIKVHATSKDKQGTNKGGKASDSSRSASDGTRAKQATLKIVLGEALGYGPALSEHMILDSGLAPNTKVGKDNKLDDGTLQVLAQAIDKFEDWLHDIISGDRIPEGYILMQNKNFGKVGLPSEPESRGQVIHYYTTSLFPLICICVVFLMFAFPLQMYDEFCPILLNQFKSREYTKFETFDAALDEFYSKIESQRAEQQQKTKESSAIQKLSKIRTDQVLYCSSSRSSQVYLPSKDQFPAICFGSNAF